MHLCRSEQQQTHPPRSQYLQHLFIIFINCEVHYRVLADMTCFARVSTQELNGRGKKNMISATGDQNIYQASILLVLLIRTFLHASKQL